MHNSTSKKQQTFIYSKDIFIHIFEIFPFSYLLTNISLVCKEWHSYVYDTHVLWNAVEFNLQEKKDKSLYESFQKFCIFCKVGFRQLQRHG
jgi:hypothetical protein